MSHERDGDLSDLERLRALYQASSAPEPAEDVWNGVQSRVHESVGRTASVGGALRRPVWMIAGLSAAAALMGLLLAKSLWTVPPLAAPQPQAVVEPFPVADADDVRIVSMDARDAASLVVGELPVAGVVEFAQPEDIRVIRCERCPHSGRKARLVQGGEVPMFVSAALEVPNDD